MKKELLIIAFCGLSISIFGQVGVGTTHPDPSSILDITASDKGLLIPRVSLNSIYNNSIGSVPNAEGLIIYNINASVTDGSGKGYYYWDGNIWLFLTTSNDSGTPSTAGWDLQGNSISNTDFLGTTNYEHLIFKVNNTQISKLHPQGGVSIGIDAVANDNRAIALGNNSNAQANETLAVGVNANAGSYRSSAIGYQSNSTSNEAMALGFQAKAGGYQSTALGHNSRATTNEAVAVGNKSTAGGYQSIALGHSATTSQNRSTAVGYGARATNQNTTALGSNTVASGQNATALGYNASATRSNTIIIGDTNSNVQGNGSKTGIGTTNPSAKLHVEGSFRYIDGNQEEGKVLVSDDNGNTRWEHTVGTKKAYGQLFKTNNISLSNSNYLITFGESGVSKNVIIEDEYIGINTTGVYELNYSSAIYFTSNNSRAVEFYLIKVDANGNASLIENSFSEIKSSSNNTYFNTNKTVLAELNKDDILLLYAVSNGNSMTLIGDETSLLAQLID